MSDVISFRLDKDNPREAAALQVLHSWSEKGYNFRHIITEALIRMKDRGSISETDDLLMELKQSLGQFNRLFEKLGDENCLPASQKNEESYKIALPRNFIDSIQKTAKPGIRPDH